MLLKLFGGRHFDRPCANNCVNDCSRKLPNRGSDFDVEKNKNSQNSIFTIFGKIVCISINMTCSFTKNGKYTKIGVPWTVNVVSKTSY